MSQAGSQKQENMLRFYLLNKIQTTGAGFSRGSEVKNIRWTKALKGPRRI